MQIEIWQLSNTEHAVSISNYIHTDAHPQTFTYTCCRVLSYWERERNIQIRTWNWENFSLFFFVSKYECSAILTFLWTFIRNTIIIGQWLLELQIKMKCHHKLIESEKWFWWRIEQRKQKKELNWVWMKWKWIDSMRELFEGKWCRLSKISFWNIFHGEPNDDCLVNCFESKAKW